MHLPLNSFVTPLPAETGLVASLAVIFVLAHGMIYPFFEQPGRKKVKAD